MEMKRKKKKEKKKKKRKKTREGSLNISSANKITSKCMNIDNLL